nr:hypothetical protein [Sorangium cellulosum]
MHLRDVQVEQLDVAVPVDEHVLRFHVAVHDPEVVRRREAVGDLNPDVERPRDRQRRLHLADPAQRLALEQLHGDPDRAVRQHVGAVHGDDVLVPQPAERDGLLAGALAHLLGAGVVGEQQLERDPPLRELVDRLVDGAEAAPAEHPHEPVARDDAARKIGSRGRRRPGRVVRSAVLALAHPTHHRIKSAATIPKNAAIDATMSQLTAS